MRGTNVANVANTRLLPETRSTPTCSAPPVCVYFTPIASGVSFRRRGA